LWVEKLGRWRRDTCLWKLGCDWNGKKEELGMLYQGKQMDVEGRNLSDVIFDIKELANN
jgi:hypothetical protein